MRFLPFILLLLLVSFVGTPLGAAAEPAPLRIHWIDVEGGAATLVVDVEKRVEHDGAAAGTTGTPD